MTTPHRPSRLLPVSPLFSLALFGIWLLFSGKLEVFHLSVGVVFVALATWMTARMVPPDEAVRPRMRILSTLWYLCWLAVQMVASAIYVMRVIVRPNKHLDPRIVELHSPQPSILSSVLLANSITLTPGTLTMDLDGDVFVVHALTRKTANDLLSGEMGRRVAALSKVPKPTSGSAAPEKEPGGYPSRGEPPQIHPEGAQAGESARVARGRGEARAASPPEGGREGPPPNGHPEGTRGEEDVTR